MWEVVCAGWEVMLRRNENPDSLPRQRSGSFVSGDQPGSPGSLICRVLGKLPSAARRGPNCDVAGGWSRTLIFMASRPRRTEGRSGTAACFHAAAALVICLILAACSTPVHVPAPTPSPAEHPASTVNRPGALAWSADWSTVDVGLQCFGDPIVCTTDKTFGTFPPGCDNCWTPGLNYIAPSPGFPLVSTAEFDGGMVSIRAVVSFTCDYPETGDGAYAGPALIWGESLYRAIYYRCAGLPAGQIQPHIFETRTEVPLGSKTYPEGSSHELRIDWYRDRAEYFVDNVLEFTEYEGSIGPDTVVRDKPVHAALWLGNSHGTVGQFDVYTGGP